jgi:hypothetical protein
MTSVEKNGGKFCLELAVPYSSKGVKLRQEGQNINIF